MRERKVPDTYDDFSRQLADHREFDVFPLEDMQGNSLTHEQRRKVVDEINRQDGVSASIIQSDQLTIRPARYGERHDTRKRALQAIIAKVATSGNT